METTIKENNKTEPIKNFDLVLNKQLQHLEDLTNTTKLRPEQLLAMAHNDIINSNKATRSYVMYDFNTECREHHIHTRQFLDDIDYVAPITSFINKNDVLVYANLAEEHAVTSLDAYNVLSSLLNSKIALY